MKLGTLAITALETNETCDGTIFDPLNLARGVEGPENDPLFTQRQPAYAISIGARNYAMHQGAFRGPRDVWS